MHPLSSELHKFRHRILQQGKLSTSTTMLFARARSPRLQPTRLPIKPSLGRRDFSKSSRRFAAPEKFKISSNYTAPQVPKSSTSNQLPFLPLVAIFCLGTFSFYWITKQREGQGKSHYVLPERAPTSKEQLAKRKETEQ